MSNLKKRIEGLKSTTRLQDVITACDEALSQYNIAELSHLNISAGSVTQIETSVAETLISKIEHITESEVQDFISSERNIIIRNSLGVAKALRTIRESENGNHPAVMYIVERLLNMSNAPEWMIIDEVIEALTPLTWEPVIKEQLNALTVTKEKFNEDIKIFRAVYEAESSRSSFIVSGLKKDIDIYVNSRTSENRAKLLEKLSKYNYDANIRSLYNVILESERGFQLKAGSDNAFVSNIYSPVIITEKEEFFAVHGKAYVKRGNTIRPLTEEETRSLPEDFTFISSFLNQSNVEVSENRIKIFSRDKKVELVEESQDLSIHINGKKVSRQDFNNVYLNAGIFRFEERGVISAVSKIAENWDTIFHLDFAKSIVPKGIPSRRADIFKLGDKTYIHTVDGVMKESKFYPDCNATQSRNLILEFATFDLGLTYKDFLLDEERKINSLEEKRKEYVEAIDYLNAKKTLLESIEDSDVRESDEVKDLVYAIDEEMSTLKNEYFEVQNKINSLKIVNEGVGATVGDEVEYLKKKQ
jgi:hypothetical protein